MSVPLFSSFFASVPIIPSVLVILSITALHHVIIRPLFLSPLRHVPGPKLAAITSFYVNRHYYNDTAVQFIKALHDKYGPVVRVGPSEIVVNDPEHLQLIYGVRSTFPKPPTAILNQNYGYPNAFSSITREEHRQNRRPTAKIYTMGSILNNASLAAWIRGRLDIFSNMLDDSSPQPIDIYSLTGYFALDVVSYLVYGQSLDALGGHNLQVATDIRRVASASARFVRFSWLFIGVLGRWPLTLLLPKSIVRLFVAVGSIEAVNSAQIDRVNSCEEKPDPAQTTVGCIQAQPGFGKTLFEGHVKSECADHVMAGADTTAASMTYMLYTLARPENRKYQDKLRHEVSKLPSPLDFKELCKLPYLDICVLESLRLHSPGPGSLQQRVTPASEPTVLTNNGRSYTLPPSTMVGIQAYSLHRSEAIFGARTDEFLPERWETANETQLQKMKDAWITFGTGARICLGMNLAMLEVKVVVATVLRAFTIEVPKNFDPNDMEPILAAVLRPKSEKCELVFRRVSSAS